MLKRAQVYEVMYPRDGTTMFEEMEESMNKKDGGLDIVVAEPNLRTMPLYLTDNRLFVLGPGRDRC
jgi:hypothetical protein